MRCLPFLYFPVWFMFIFQLWVAVATDFGNTFCPDSIAPLKFWFWNLLKGWWWRIYKTELCFQYQPVVETLLTSDHTGLPLVQMELFSLLCAGSTEFSLFYTHCSVCCRFEWHSCWSGRLYLSALFPVGQWGMRFVAEIMNIRVNAVCCRVAQVVCNLCHFL